MKNTYFSAYYWSSRKQYAARETFIIVKADGQWYLNLKAVSEEEAEKALAAVKEDYKGARWQGKAEEYEITAESAQSLIEGLMRGYDKYTDMIDNFAQQCEAENKNRQIAAQVALINEAIAA